MNANKQAGFSVVELLITLIVIGVVFGSFMTTFLTIKNITKISSDIQSANTVAYAKIQEYQDKSYSSLPSTTPKDSLVEVEDFTSQLPSDLPGTKSAKVYLNSYTSGSLKQVVVRITYGDTANLKRIEYADFIQKYGI